MKRSTIILFGAALIGIAACNKVADQVQPATTATPTGVTSNARQGADDTTVVDDHGGHGNDDSTDNRGNNHGNGGGNSGSGNAEIIKDFKLGNSFLKATKPDSMQLVLRKPAPAAGYTVTFTSSDPAVHPPVSLTIAPGTTTRYVVLNSTAVSTSRKVTVQATINGQSESDSFNLLP